MKKQEGSPLPLSAPKSAEAALTRYLFDFHNEHDVIMSLAYNRPEGYCAKLNVRGKYGRADLVLWNDTEIRVYEVKFHPTVNDIAHALGQVLLYREQFKDPKQRMIRYIIYASAEIAEHTYKFLKNCCAKYDVILHFPEMESERQAFDIKKRANDE